MGSLLVIAEQGLIYGIMALGLYLSYRILNFPDLTVDGSFPMGAAVAAVLIVSGWNPYLACLAAFACGMLAGLVTGILHVRFHITNLLSGILTMTALYSINLHIAGGRANLQMNKGTQKALTIFTDVPASFLPSALDGFRVVLVLLVCVLVLKWALDWFLGTKAGFLLRAVGDNPQLITAMGQNSGMVKLQGLALANGCVALAGAIFAQQQRYFDASMGTGMMVTGLASVILGSILFGRLSFLRATTTVILGSIVYKALTLLALNLGAKVGLRAYDLKLITSVLFFVALLINNRGTFARRAKTGDASHADNTDA